VDDDLMYARTLGDQLGEIFCVTFIKGVDDADALSRLGAYPDTVRGRTDKELHDEQASFEAGFPKMAAALDLGSWTVVIEPGGFEGAEGAVGEAASRGTAVVSALRHDYAEPHFGYAVDGTTVAAFNPAYPAEENMWGSDPGQLHQLLPVVGLREPTEDDDGWRDAWARAIMLAHKITGVRVPLDPLAVPRLSGQIEPWFRTAVPRGDLLSARRHDPDSGELVAAVEAASPQVRRAVAVAQARRQAAALGLADTPGLGEALELAAHGTAEPVPMDSPLGRHVRAWLDAEKRASDSLNGPYRGRLSDAERQQAYGVGWFVNALRGVLDPDPRVAVLAALRPLTSGIAVLGDAASRAEAVRQLRA
jgi:uncharacterized protein DUF6461